MFEVQLYLRFI